MLSAVGAERPADMARQLNREAKEEVRLMSVKVPDSGQVHTLPELIDALQGLRAGRSYAQLDKAAGGRLPRSTLSDLFNKGTASRETLELFLRACGVTREWWQGWQQARERALSASQPGTAGLIRVAQANPRWLGVHAAVDVPGAVGDLPAYVERDTDTVPAGIRALIRKAASDGQGGLVVLVGSSSVGKTRSAFEAVRALVPDWWLAHPDDAGQVRALAVKVPDRLVVWLDELQKYLDSSDGLEAGTVRTLLGRGAVLVATLWPGRYHAYTAPVHPGHPDPYVQARAVLGLADVVDIGEAFSAAERKSAERVAAAGDARLALALKSADYGLTQTIAAAPQLVRRWRQADPYAAAVLTAAVDATRLGVTSPLPAELLRAAAPGYCDARQHAKAKPNWFEAALAYLTDELHGAAAALAPVAAPGQGMGQAAGYRVADYLQQQAGAERCRAKVPATFWQAFVDHVVDARDQERIGKAADDRLLYGYAELLYRTAAQTGDQHAGHQLADMLTRQGRAEEALAIYRDLADDGDSAAAHAMADLLVEQGQLEEALEVLRQDESGDSGTAWYLALLLAEQGRIDELQMRAEAGNPNAALYLANQGHAVEALEILRRQAGSGEGLAVKFLAGLLAAKGHAEEALEMLRKQVGSGDSEASLQLAELLAKQGLVKELQTRADSGDSAASLSLAMLLAKHERAEELRERTDSGDRFAGWYLAELLAAKGHVEEGLEILRQQAGSGVPNASEQLAELLAKQGLVEELWTRADSGDSSAAWYLALLLTEQGRVDELRERADSGDRSATEELAELLAEQGRVDELRELVRSGSWYAVQWLAHALEVAGCEKEARHLRRYGLAAD
ncbi:hypothetical protein AB0J35_28100 [Nonomuraea angiospora]|uniref:tetratricopeptide repeat protein n=1 Tax=Nonomuraea angiospora TaxID=46172 RepID=UPI003440CFC2